MKKRLIISSEGDYCETFKNTEHLERFNQMLNYISTTRKTDSTKLDPDEYAAAYLIALDRALYAHRTDIIFDDLDRYERQDNPAAVLFADWQTEDSRQTTRLLLHLYGYDNNNSAELDPDKLTPAQLFDTENSPYYIQAIKLRYPDHNQAQTVTIRARTAGQQRRLTQ